MIRAVVNLYRRHGLVVAGAMVGGAEPKATLGVLSLAAWFMVPGFVVMVYAPELLAKTGDAGETIGFLAYIAFCAVLLAWMWEWGFTYLSSLRGNSEPALRKIELLKQKLGEEKA